MLAISYEQFVRHRIHKSSQYMIMDTHTHTDSPVTECLRQLITRKGIKIIMIYY